MRLITFRPNAEPDSDIRFGAVSGADNRKIVDLSARMKLPSVRALLESGRLDEARQLVSRLGADFVPEFGIDEIKFLPPLPDPQKIICIGLNYAEHRAETGRSATSYPVLFSRFPDSLTGHLNPLIAPVASNMLDFEGELAVIISRAGRAIAEQDAMSYVAGYSCFNDATVRDWQSHTSQFLPGKNFPATGGFGPWIVTPDEIPDPADLKITTRLNGHSVQNGHTGDMLFPIPRLITYISTFTNLNPGDIISTGTPAGVGFRRDPPLFLQPGDEISVEISGIGVLSNPVVAETP